MLVLTSSCDYLKLDLCRSREGLAAEAEKERKKMRETVALQRAVANWRITKALAERQIARQECDSLRKERECLKLELAEPRVERARVEELEAGCSAFEKALQESQTTLAQKEKMTAASWYEMECRVTQLATEHQVEMAGRASAELEVVLAQSRVAEL